MHTQYEEYVQRNQRRHPKKATRRSVAWNLVILACTAFWLSWLSSLL